MKTPTTTENITSDMIFALLREASEAGDEEMVDTCNDAMNLRIDAKLREICKWDCARAISSARAMDDSTPYVRVVAGASS